jgi:hypothetical protein
MNRQPAQKPLDRESPRTLVRDEDAAAEEVRGMAAIVIVTGVALAAATLAVIA